MGEDERVATVLVCTKCHHQNADDSRFCGRCGATLVAPREQREERKVITVLFTDLVGFTSRAEQMDVEDVIDHESGARLRATSTASFSVIAAP